MTLTDTTAPTDATEPYRAGIDDLGDAPLGAENPLNPAPSESEDPIRSEGEYRRAVLTLLTEIRDALLTSPEG